MPESQQHPIEVIRQGYQISNEMKADLVEFYHKSLTQDQYNNKSDFIRHHLEEKYGRCFSIIVYATGSFVSHSFLHADDFLLELKSQDHNILAYLLPPSYAPPPLMPIYEPAPVYEVTPVYAPPKRVYDSYVPPAARAYDSYIPQSRYQSPPRIYQSYYGSYPRRGYGYW